MSSITITNKTFKCHECGNTRYFEKIAREVVQYRMTSGQAGDEMCRTTIDTEDILAIFCRSCNASLPIPTE